MAGASARTARHVDAAQTSLLPPELNEACGPSVDQQCLSGDVRGGIGGQEHDGGRDILLVAESAQRDRCGQRIVLITDRRLGAWNDRWKLTAPGATPGEAANYDFSVIELHLNAKNEGEGKASLAGKLAVDANAKTIALDSYDSLPVVLKAVKRK